VRVLFPRPVLLGKQGKRCLTPRDAEPDIRRGDIVEVALDDSVVLKASLALYGIPLVAFLAGVLIGYGLSFLVRQGTAMAILLPVMGGFLLLIPGILASRRTASQ